MLGVFCKNQLNVKLKGITNNAIDPSVDHIKVAFLPILSAFTLNDEELFVRIVKRGKSFSILNFLN